MIRSAVIINCISLVSLLVFFQLIKEYDWDPVLLVYETIPAIALIISHIKLFSFRKTKAGNSIMRGENQEKLSEIAYSMFSVAVIAVLLAWHLVGWDLHVVLIISMLYLAYAIPVYLAVWTATKRF